ncbi:MAG: NUDIX domain-containing protein [Halanaeroarchaeum sp.]
MEETRVVTVFLREGADVLLLRRSDEVGSYPGLWGAVAGHAEDDPDAMARTEIEEETGLDPAAVDLVRRGETFPVEDEERGTRWLVTPYLFDVPHRDVDPNYETAVVEWAPPTEILRRETVPDLWGSYWRVAPTVETVRSDEEHGSAYVSLRALEVLRDAAALAVERDQGDWAHLEKTAHGLLDARPTMAAVRNRVNRVMAVAVPEGTPAAVERAATDALSAAQAADGETAERAAAALADERVVTLSRSGTVEDALTRGDPAGVTVAESRPGGEGVAVAERLAEAGVDVTLTTDANLPGAVESGSLVLVGADTVLADGAVVNKVGSRAAALAAADAGVDCYAVCASDKISPDESVPIEAGHPPALYEGDRDVDEANPVFERVPARLVDGAITEAGILRADQIESVAAVHAARSLWTEE